MILHAVFRAGHMIIPWQEPNRAAWNDICKCCLKATTRFTAKV